ncbi:MAG: hypothetical protein RL701_1714 [Pseudomonadota bacterium]
MGAAQPLTVIRERYRLDAPIGEGGMATVWRAWDLTLQRPIAVKLLFARDSHTNEALVDRFLREARIAASVQHRNVIHIVDFGTTQEGQPFMVMELLEGETLAARLRRQKPLPVADVVQIGHLTLRGLAAVHAAGIVHRDLKPENVYLRDEGGVTYPKILDFGISRSIDPATGARPSQATREGIIVGTPEYMSPEQARGVKQLGYRTDLYSMGVVLYESLTGRLPYSSENVGDLIVKIVTGCATPVHELVPTVPREVSDVVSRAMERLPSDRFADAAEMQEALLAASQAKEFATLPMFSDLPPDPAPSAPRLPRSSPRPAHTLPRTQAVRLQMLAPAAPLVQRPFATTNPPPPAAGDTQDGHGGRLLRDPENQQAHHDSSGERVARIGSDSPFALVEAAPYPSPYPATGFSDGSPPAPFGSPLPPITSSERTRELIEAAVVAEPPPDALRAKNTEDSETVPMITSDLRRHWLAPTLASLALLSVGLVALWLAPNAPPEPRTEPPQNKEPSAADHSAATAAPTVSLTLTGLPSEAVVTLDGQPASAVLTLARGEQPHSIAVVVAGKQPWHVSYVPQADHTLEVVLVDTPAIVSPGPRPATKRLTKPHSTKQQGPLRVPDF